MSCKLPDIVEFNPDRNIKKGQMAPFIDMASLPINARDVQSIILRKYKGGGSRFADGDTLFARITPCLENGKTAKVAGLGAGVNGHGSTEFIVMAAKKPDFDEDFVYYIARFLEFRAYARQRMEGTSGRQRVSWQALSEFEFDFPDEETRKEIGLFLKVLDDKIELNQKINQTLEEMVQAIFKEWFIDFRFPGYDKVKFDNGLPESWKRGTLKDVCEIINGFAFKSQDYVEKGYKIIRTKNFNKHGYIDLKDLVYLTENKAQQYKKFNLKAFDFLLVMVGASLGKHAIVFSNVLPALQNQNMWNFRAKNKSYQIYLNCTMLRIILRNLKSASGSARDFFRKDYFYKSEIIIPSDKIVKLFDGIVRPLLEQKDLMIKEMQVLTEIRDTLLPKLMSGDIEIK